MSMAASVPLATLAVIIIVSCACWRLCRWLWWRPKELERHLRQQGFSGNPYRVLFGDMKEVRALRKEAMLKPIGFTNDYLARANPFLHRTIELFGKNSFVWIGPFPVVNITEPELIREVFSRIHDFQKPRLNRISRLLIPGLAQYEGEKWAKHRKLINPAFHVEELKLMMPAFYTCCVELISKWEEMLSDTSSHEVDVWPYLVKLSADVISRSAFGSSYEEGRRIFLLLKEQTDLTIQMFQTSFIPGWRYLPTPANKRMRVLNEEIQGLIGGIVNKRKQAMDAGETPKDDLLGILMDSSLGEGKSSQRVRLTSQEVIEECKLFYFAGQETTSVLLVWSMVLLAKHQDWQEKARDEVLKTFGNNQPEYDGLNQLKIVMMILNEVLRLYPPVIALTRSVPNDTKLGNLSFPAGVLINLVMVSAHQDTKLWGDDAKEFRPDRFAEGISKAVGGNAAFFPFGWGPRICIGQNFAMMEAKLALAMILQRFSFELSPSYAHAPFAAITMQPQYGAHLLLRAVHM